MMNHQREKIVEIISEEIRSCGHVRMNQLTLLLEKHGGKYGISRSIYGNQGPKRWIVSNFPEFKVDGNNGKEIILFSTDADSTGAGFTDSVTTVVEEKLSYSVLCGLTASTSTESPYRVGVVNFCNYKNAFINQWHGENKPDDEGLAIKFNPTLIQTIPERSVFDTKSFVYLVCYATSGKVRNPKTGLDHPALDYSTPIKIIRTLPIRQCAYIRISAEEVIVGHVVSADDVTSLDRVVIAIDAFLRNEISKNDYVLSAFFPNIAKKCGLPNFRSYADSVELFLEKYLPDYELKKNITIQGKLYPGIIVLKGETPADIETTDDSTISAAKVIIPDMSFAVLDQLFESGRYVDFLASDIMKKMQPQELPLEYLEKALTCAHRLIYPESLESVSLNAFQRELVNNPTTAMFIKKWKNHGVYSEDIVAQCGDTAIAHFDYPEHSALVVKLLNAIGAEKTLNNNYVGITTRFVACENVLIPHFYIIRAFVQNSKTSIQKIVSEYCQIVKDMRHSTSGPRMSDDLRTCSFDAVLRIIHNNVFDCSQLAQNIRTNIASVFVEYDKMRVLQELIPLWDTEGSSLEWHLVDLYFNLGGWTEQRFIQLLNDGVSRELLQRCLALLWREAYHDNILNKNYLNLLSWVILHDDYSSIDEVIRYSSGKGLSRIDKQNMLINSFETVCNYAGDNDKMYVLASYIIFVIRANIDPNNATTDVTEMLDSWNKFSNSFYTQKTQHLNCITPETESQFVDLFAVFHMDFPNYLKLQTHYAEWFVRTYPPADLSIENIDVVFEELYSKGAYFAFVEYYSLDSRLEIEEARKRHAGQYIESLIHLHRYTDAISFLWASQSLDASERNTLLVQAIGENFRENGISPKAFACIGETSMRNEAVKMLLAEFKPTQPLIINSLMALYVYEKKYIHAAYLFTIFGSKVDKGFVRLYGQIRSQLGKYVDFNKLKSQHHVIAYAFQTLNTDALIDFLNWASRITIPNYKDHREGHVFSFYYDNIIANVSSEEAWVSFLNHLVKNGLERNAYNICVCETVLRKVLNFHDSNYSQGALDYILNSTNTALYPPNFLIYAFEIIKDSQSVSLCQRLVDALSNKILYQHIITDNVWLNSYEENIKAFKRYCQNAYGTSGHSAFHEILSLLGTELSIFELKALAQSATSKQALFSRICHNYLNDCNIQETIEILFSEDWPSMTENEYTLLSILRIVYSDDDVLLLDKEGLFDDEYSVRRFKRDCIEILSTYPEKTGLFTFDKACSNESHKMLVYSYIFEVLYDQDIYESLDKRFSDFTDLQSYRVYLRLLWCAYKAQSIQNSTFPFFYKKWRYLKLYLSLVLRSPTCINDADILALMEKNGHYDDVYANAYIPFVEAVNQFIELDGLEQKFKNHFLFAVMVSHAEDLYDSYAQILCEMPAHYKLICRKLITLLDFRYFNTSLYSHLWNNIRVGDFSVALPLAESISDYAFDALVALKDRFDSSAVSIFEQLAFMDKGSQILNSIVAMDVAEISKHHHWLIPLLCSKQFDFLISDRFRSLVITQRDNLVCEKYKYISDYLVCKGKSKGIYIHLCALLSCIKKNSELAKSIIDDNDFCSLVPHDWTDEARRIVEFANGTVQKFKPNKVRSDGSRENTVKNVKFVFPSRLLKSVFGEENIPTTVQTANDSYTGYLEADDPWMQSKLGLETLLWRANTRNTHVEVNIPPVNDLVLDIGLGLLRPEVGLTIENRLSIIAELYINRSVFSSKKYSAQTENLKSKFAAIINSGLSLALWVKYGTIIEEFLREANALIDFADLRKRILDECAELASPDISNDEKHKGYTSLLNTFSGLTSPYSMSVMRALKDEIERLANGIRLSIKIENEKLETTDNCVYFRVSNVGNRTVSFSTEALAVVLQQKDQPDVCVNIEHIAELHSGSTTGGRVRLIVFSEKRIPVKLMITHTTPSGLTEIVCSTEEELSITAPCSPNVPVEALTAARESVSFAVTDDQLLFGRNDKKELLAKSIPSGVTLIYGPSRIGKTSLMNWIRNRHAIDKGNVLSVLIGGENGLGKDADYKQKITDRTKAVPYDDPYQMSQYLLIDTLVYGLNKKSRMRNPGNIKLPHSLIGDMLRILKDDVTSIESKYFEINDLLEASGIELWLLLDEFQQVVEQWSAPSWCEFVEICNLLSSPDQNKPNNIKIIFCGSDDLLTHMILKRDSVWKKVFPSTVPVNALQSEDFEAMIKHDRAISMTNLSFSPSAIATLFSYTGGIALYGKEICRAIFEEISENAPKWASRNTIYTSDIAEATQRLLSRQNHELSIRAQEGISTIYAAVTKNLDERTDMQLLWFMAKWLYQNPQRDGFPENYFAKEALTPRFGARLHDSFSIAEARGIIRKSTSHYNNETVYTFNTLFYYFAFCGSATKDNLDETLIFAPADNPLMDSSEDEVGNPYDFDNIIQIAPDFDEMYSPKQQRAFLGALALSSDTTVQDSLRRLAGTTQSGQIFNGDVKILQVNQIASSIMGLSDLVREISSGNTDFSDERLGTYLADMPRLSLRPAGEPISDDEMSKFDTDTYVETVEEGVKKSFENNADFEGKTLDDWAYQHLDQLTEMGVSEEDIDFAMTLHDRDKDSVLIALYLRCLFDEIVELTEKMRSSITLDYSPITIMLSKTLERILKEKHLPIYLDNTVWVNRVSTYSDDERIKRSPISFAGMATIGTFTTAMFAMFKISPSDPEKEKKEINRDNFVTRTGTSIRNWKPYMHGLNTAKRIRNNTAHVEPVTQEDCDQFVELIFKSKLLKHTIEYVGS